MSVLAEVSIMPLGVGESISKQVAQAVEVVAAGGLNYKLCPMGTIIEGEIDQVFDVVKQCQERLGRECSRMIISVRMDWRKGPQPRMDENIEHVQQHLGGKARA
jgi:uncharacterized protein (TIGR00106 family)